MPNQISWLEKDGSGRGKKKKRKTKKKNKHIFYIYICFFLIPSAFREVDFVLQDV